MLVSNIYVKYCQEIDKIKNKSRTTSNKKFNA